MTLNQSGRSDVPRETIVERLHAGDVLIMDGGTGVEIERRGVDVHGGRSVREPGAAPTPDTIDVQANRRYLRESDPEAMRRVHEAVLRELGPWSATANVVAPDVVRSVHEDYLREGADIIISNNFFTSRAKLAQVGLGDEWEQYARAGAEIAAQARDAVNPDAYVAGGLAPSGVDDVRSEYAERARLIADLGVDFMLPEYLGAIDECVAAVEGCATVGLPVLLGVRHVSEQGTMQYRESFEALAHALDGAPVDGILLMCSHPSEISAALPKLRQAYDGPIGAYSHEPRENVHGPMGAGARQHRVGHDADEIERFAEYGLEWISMGAQVVGGCCGTRPEHIAALVRAVRTQPQRV
jgi:homocysteine S-methyltransferase